MLGFLFDYDFKIIFIGFQRFVLTMSIFFNIAIFYLILKIKILEGVVLKFKKISVC